MTNSQKIEKMILCIKERADFYGNYLVQAHNKLNAAEWIYYRIKREECLSIFDELIRIRDTEDK